MTYEQFIKAARLESPYRYASVAAKYPVISDGSPSWRTIRRHELTFSSSYLDENLDDEGSLVLTESNHNQMTAGMRKSSEHI